MNYCKYLVIGGGIAGTTAAETIRKYDPNGSLVIVEDEKYPLYSRMSLYDYIADPEYGDKIFLRKEEDYKEKNIDLLLGVRVEKIDAGKKEVYLSDGQVLKFEKLLIASGGTAARPEIACPNDHSVGRASSLAMTEQNIFYYQNLDDAKRIKEKLPSLKNVAVLGASFAAFELAELFRSFNINVDMFVRRQFLGGAIDENLENYLKDVLAKNGVNLKMGEDLFGCHPPVPRQNDLVGLAARTGSRGGGNPDLIQGLDPRFHGDDKTEKYCNDYDGVAIAVGLERNFKIFQDAGINCNKGILVDEYLRTNMPDIYAAGDVAEYFDANEQKHILSGSWVGAFTQGKIAGENMAVANPAKKFETMPTYTTNIFGNQIAFLGYMRYGANQGEKRIFLNDLKNNKYILLHTVNNFTKGAILMNANEKREEITQLISKEN